MQDPQERGVGDIPYKILRSQSFTFRHHTHTMFAGRREHDIQASPHTRLRGVSGEYPETGMIQSLSCHSRHHAAPTHDEESVVNTRQESPTHDEESDVNTRQESSAVSGVAAATASVA